MIGGAKGIGIGIDFGIPNQYCRATSKPYIEKDVLDSLRVVASAYGKSNNDSDRAIVKNLVDPDNPFVISNAAYDKMSSYGGYEFAKFNSSEWFYRNREDGIDIIERNAYSFTAKRIGTGQYFYDYQNRSITVLNKSLVVKAISNNNTYIRWEYKYRTAKKPDVDSTLTLLKQAMTPNVPITVTLPYKTEEEKADLGVTEGSDSYLFYFDPSDIPVGEEYTVEMLPLFEGAFVTDGIDDLITSTKTVQEMLGGSNEITVVSMAHFIKGESNAPEICRINQIRRDTRSIRNSISKIGKSGIFGYTYKNGVTTINNILGDKNDCTAEGNLDGIVAPFSVEGYYYNNNSNPLELCSIAWYWTVIANKVLTTDQINQVIAYFNLDRTLKPDILCDVKKQGITNDNHAEFGDKLIDFSGNGRDIQLNNIAWKGDSGIGKYEVDFLDSSIWNSSNSTITSSKIDCKNAISHIMLLYYSVGSKEYPDIPSFKVIKTGADIDYSYIDETGFPRSVRIVDGVNILPASHNTLYSGSGRFCGFGNPGMGNSVTITQIPSHAGGLCLDGVNDFGKVTGMPIYKDYTVVTDREIFANTGAISSKSNPGAFVETAGNSVYSFGQATSGLNFISTRSISYLSKYSYCGQSITAGAAEDGTDMWLGTIRDNDHRFFNGAIYSLMSFPYSMSEFLIERQLKKHKLGTLYPDMVEFRPVIKANANYKITYYQIDSTNAWKSIKVGDYIVIGAKLAFQITFDNDASELKEVVSPQLSGIIVEKRPPNPGYNIYSYITSKSPQKIDITIYQPPEYLTMLSNSTLISNETLIKNE